MTNFEFEEFDKSALPPRGELTITWQKRGQIGFSKAAYEALGKPEAVKLYFDRKQRVMGIKASDLQEQNAIRVKAQPGSGSRMIAGSAFATRYEIPLGDKAKRYRAEMHDDILTVDLEQKPADASKVRKRDDN